jgi:hypothetical protein
VDQLFQNRYESIVVGEEPYLLELVRSLHPAALYKAARRVLCGAECQGLAGQQR